MRTGANLLRSRKGSVALEFGLVAGPLMLFIVAIMDLGLGYWAGALLDSATQDTARQIRTGELQAAAAQNGVEKTAEELFKENICAAMEALISCDESDRFAFDVRSFENFDSVDLSPPDTDEDTGAVIIRFQPGTPNEVILVRTYYRWAINTPGLQNLMSAHLDGDGNVVLSATVAFRNEPFPVVEGEEAGGES